MVVTPVYNVNKRILYWISKKLSLAQCFKKSKVVIVRYVEVVPLLVTTETKVLCKSNIIWIKPKADKRSCELSKQSKTPLCPTKLDMKLSWSVPNIDLFSYNWGQGTLCSFNRRASATVRLDNASSDFSLKHPLFFMAYPDPRHGGSRISNIVRMSRSLATSSKDPKTPLGEMTEGPSPIGYK